MHRYTQTNTCILHTATHLQTYTHMYTHSFSPPQNILAHRHAQNILAHRHALVHAHTNTHTHTHFVYHATHYHHHHTCFTHRPHNVAFLTQWIFYTWFRLGGGIFGDTHMAKWNEMTVAVKRLTLLVHEHQITPDAMKLMQNEVWFLRSVKHLIPSCKCLVCMLPSTMK